MCLALQLLKSILTISTALQEQGLDRRATSDTSNEQPGQNIQNAPGLPSDVGRLDGRDVMERETQGRVTGRSPAVAPEHTLGSDHRGGDARNTVRSSRRSESECRSPSSVHCIKIHQVRREPGARQHSGQPPFQLRFQRQTRMGLVLSRLSWGSSPPSMLVTRFACYPCLHILVKPIQRRPPLRETRSKTSSHG